MICYKFLHAGKSFRKMIFYNFRLLRHGHVKLRNYDLHLILLRFVRSLVLAYNVLNENLY